MKILFSRIFLVPLIVSCLFPIVGFGQSIGIGAVTFTPVASAVLEINGVTGFGTPRGLLIPKMSTSQRNAIVSPVSGLIIYNSDDNKFYYWDSAQWIPLSTGQGWGVLGNAGLTAGTNFIGTTDQTSFEIRTNNTPFRFIISEIGSIAGNIGIGTPLPAEKLDVIGNIRSNTIIKTNFFEGSSLAAGGPVYANPGTGRLYIGTSNSSDWTIAGNTGINPAVNFIGTGDAVDFITRTNNVERMRVKSTGPVLINSAAAISPNSLFEVTAASTFPWAINGFTNVAATNPADAVAVYGVATAGGIGVYGMSNKTGVVGAGNNATPRFYTNPINAIQGSGVTGTGNYGGVFGSGTDVNLGIGIIGYGNNIVTASIPPRGSGVFGEGFSFGIYGVAQSANATSGLALTGGGYFVQGPSYSYVGARHFGINYKVVGFGAASTIVPDLNDNPVVMFATESPEVLFEDFGTGVLVNGEATILLDPIFVKNITVNDDHPLRVFIQPEGDCNGVYVSSKSASGFTINELSGGTANIPFTYRVVANRASDATSRYDKVRFPPGPGKADVSEPEENK